MPRLKFIQEDVTELRSLLDDSVESLSSMNVAEHFGLGRYGHPLDPDGHVKFMRSLAHVLKPGGRLYFLVPLGVERVAFNGHRVISPFTVLEGFCSLRMVSFSAVRDDGSFHENCEPAALEKERFGCGLFEFTKIAAAGAG